MRREGRGAALSPSRRRSWRTVAGCLSLIVVLGAILFLAFEIVIAPGTETGRRVTVVIPSGSSAAEIGGILARQGVVKNARVFRLIAQYEGVSGQLRPGRHVLRQGMSYEAVLKELTKKPPEKKTITVVIPEGFTSDQIATRLAREAKLPPDDFLELARFGKQDFADNFPFLSKNPTMSLEGYLFPRTYAIKDGSKPHDVLALLLRQFDTETGALDWSVANASGRDVHHIMTIASLVEREAKIAEERPVIAGVIYNRLARGIPLQIDATVQYALPEWKETLTQDDLKVNSPYNTYLKPGLPPGPIANPGLASIQAALHPENVDYLYYVLTDPSGRHTFTRTYEEFLRAKARAKAKL